MTRFSGKRHGADDLEALTSARWETVWADASDDGRSYDPHVNPQLRDALALIRRSWPVPRNGTFLEAGCGTAANALHLAREGASVVCVDLSPTAVAKAKAAFEQRGIDGTFLVADVRDLPFTSGSFEFIYAGGVVEHFSDTTVALSEMRRTLAPGGRLLVTVPALTLSFPYLALRGNVPAVRVLEDLFAFIQLRLLKGRHADFGYERSFTRRRLERLMRDAGFDEVETGCFDTYLPLFRVPARLRQAARRLARRRAFCPMYWALGVAGGRARD